MGLGRGLDTLGLVEGGGQKQGHGHFLGVIIVLGEREKWLLLQGGFEEDVYKGTAPVLVPEALETRVAKQRDKQGQGQGL